MPTQPDSSGSIKQKLYAQLRDDILRGFYAPGAKLPPTRSLANELGISRNSVLHAYEQLTAEGYLTSRGGSGTFVSHLNNSLGSENPALVSGADSDIELRQSAYSSNLQKQVPAELFQRSRRPTVRYDFAYGEPAYANLPITTWARMVGRCARQLSEQQLGYAPHAGVESLREAVAQYLTRARGVQCSAQQVVITQGTQEAIDLCVRLLIDPGDIAVVEDPQYRGFRRCLLAAQADIAALPVDADGLQTQRLQNIHDAKLACVTPSHQFPTGATLPVSRRLQMLEWAHKNNTVVLEDDYDGEFRYSTSPMPSLQSLDRHGTVIYVGTSSKIFFPSLRIGWMVVPPRLLTPLLTLKAMADIWPSTLEQVAFAQFIQEGHLERHIHRVRKQLAGKRRVLLDTLNALLGDQVEVADSQAGIHALVRITSISAGQVAELIKRCRDLQTGVYSAAPFYVHKGNVASNNAELVLGYSSLTERQIRTGVQRLAEAVTSLRC